MQKTILLHNLIEQEYIYIQHLHRLIPYLTAMFDELDVVSCHFNRAIFLHNMMEQEYMMIWTRIYMFIYSYKHLILCRLHNPIMSHLQLIQLSYLHLCAWHTRARVSWLPITGYLKLHISFVFFAMRKLQLLLDFLRSLSMRARVLANQIVGPSEARTIRAWHGRQWDSWLASDNAHAHACTYVSHCVSVCVCLFVCLAYPGHPLTAV